MALPEREYFYLQEVVRKLDMSEFDLRYCLSHGLMPASVWVDARSKGFSCLYYDAGKGECVGSTPHPYEGYVTLAPDTCREILDTGMIEGREFYLYYPEICLFLQPGYAGIPLCRDSIMVSRMDLENFIEKHFAAPVLQKKAGRPSIMPQILAEYDHRRAAGESYKSRVREAQALHDWACAHHKDDLPPARDSIRNALIEHDKKKGSVI
jgi:hypothetical protein